MQATLFGCQPVVKKPKPRRKSAAERRAENEAEFRAFDEANNHVYEALRAMALALKRSGHDRWGIKALWEKLRYDMALKTTESQPSLNNNWTSFYARKLMAECSELVGFFELRERH